MKGREDCEFGKTPLITLIDTIAQNDPDRPFAEITTGSSKPYQFQLISMGQFARAIDKAALWMGDNFGKDSGSFVAYAGPQDVRYLILIFAGVKSGKPMFLPSLRNSPEANTSLIEAYGCRSFILPSEGPFKDMFAETIEGKALQVVQAPDLVFFLDNDGTEKYQWSSSYEKARSAPYVGLQTSGTTGLPKRVLFTQGMIMALDAFNKLPSMGHTQPLVDNVFSGRRVLNTFPFFHGGGIGLIEKAIINSGTSIIPPPGTTAHVEVLMDIITTRDIQVAALPPSVVAELTKTREGRQCLAKLDYVYTGGAPLPTEAAHVVNSHTHLILAYGSSELGHSPVLLKDKEDYQYMQWSSLWPYEMQDRGNGLHELVMVRKPELDEYQSVFTMFPDRQEFRTNDLLSRHPDPSKADLWKYEGRADDIIVFSNGEKFNPSSLEDAINGHPSVKAAIVVGTNRPQTALLVEPYGQAHEPAEFIENIWSLIEQENRKGVRTGRVEKDMIIAATPDKPFPRSGKGTVQKKTAIRLYDAELESLYKRLDEARERSSANEDVNEKSRDGDREIARRLVEALAFIGMPRLEGDDNLFDRGIDSLGISSLVRVFNKQMDGGKSHLKLTMKDVYECGSVRKLANRLLRVDSSDERSEDQMGQIFQAMRMGLPVSARAPAMTDEKTKVVILTGSTGSLGSYLLDRLLVDETVVEIVCLNRRPDAEAWQPASMKEKGLCTDFSVKRVSFRQVDFGRPRFGLEAAMYRRLLEKATHIIHNAWQVDFNVSLDHLAKPHIAGVRDFIGFSSMSKHNAHILFVSSIGAVSNWKPSQANGELSSAEEVGVPETIIEDWAAAGDIGYAQSKLISERLLAESAAESNVPCTICRVGQIAGPSTGSGGWPKQEWFPSLLLSSKYVGALPSSLGAHDRIDWIPVNDVASIISELLQRTDTTTCKVYHIVNPQTTTWQYLLEHLQTRLGVKSVPLTQWLDTVATTGEEDLTKNPALKLLDFFKDMQTNDHRTYHLSTAETLQASKTLRTLQPVSTELLDLWLTQLGL